MKFKELTLSNEEFCTEYLRNMATVSAINEEQFKRGVFRTIGIWS